jgi:hypothetical protein
MFSNQDTVMKKYFLLLTVTTNVLMLTTALSCPYTFFPDDQRPFFEQYDIENNAALQPEKEEK